MKALMRLAIYKNIGFLRNIFRKKVSAIFSVLLIAFYGFLFIFSLNNYDQQQIPSSTNLNQDLSSVVMLVFGLYLIYIVSLMMNKHTALFTQEDAFYLFSGPFSKAQVFRSLYSKSIFSALLMSFFNLFIFAMYKNNIYCTGFFYVLFFLVFFLMSFLILILVDYLYLLKITNPHNKRISQIIVFGLVALVIGSFVLSFVKVNYQFDLALKDFVVSTNLYFIPIVGYGKMILSSYILQDYNLVWLGFGLLIVLVILLYYLISHFKGEYKSKVLEDAITFSALVKKAKSGKRDSINEELKSSNASVDFKTGAKAIYSKNLLMVKKTRSYLNYRLIMPSIVYVVLAKFLDLGFMFFLFMNIFFIFSIINNSGLVTELKNYQVYLIPASAFKKLLAIITIPFIQTIVFASVSTIIGEVVFGIRLIDSINLLIFVYGFICIFFAGTIFSLRIFRSASNLVFDMFVKIFAVIIAIIPTILLMVLLYMNNLSNNTGILALTTFTTNLIISLLIIYFCKDIANGKGMIGD